MKTLLDLPRPLRTKTSGGDVFERAVNKLKCTSIHLYKNIRNNTPKWLCMSMLLIQITAKHIYLPFILNRCCGMYIR